MSIEEPVKPTASETSRCERFLKLFADTERAIKKLLPPNERRGDFQDLALRYAEIRPGIPELSDAKRLKSIFELLKRERDLLAHTGWTRPAMIPSEEVVSTLEALHQAITNPRTALEAFVIGKSDVVHVSPGWPLDRVLSVIGSNDFSQLPIIENCIFHGLITEQSITRFLARLVMNGENRIDLSTLRVEDVRASESSKETFRFCKATTPVDEIERLFHMLLSLEVVFVSASGLPSDPIIGIATSWDIVRLHKRPAA